MDLVAVAESAVPADDLGAWMMYRRNAGNLGRLASFLKDLPADFAFAMDCFASNAWDELGPLEYAPGTAGVTVGPVALAVDAGIAPSSREWTWEVFSERALIAPWTTDWDWCFSPDWAQADSSAAGVAERIELLLRDGQPPVWWSREAPAMLAMATGNIAIDEPALAGASLAAIAARQAAFYR